MKNFPEIWLTVRKLCDIIEIKKGGVFMKEFFRRLKLVKYFGWRGAFDKNFIRMG